MSDQPGSGSDPEHGGGPPPVPPVLPGQYGGGGGYGAGPQPPGYGQQPPPYTGYQGPPPPYPPPPTYASPDPNAYPGAPGYPGYPGYDDPNARRGFSGWAIASFVTGLVLPLVGILAAVPLGIVALVKISKSHARGSWMAIAGIVLSVLWWVGIIALGIWAVNNQASRNQAGLIDKAGSISFSDVKKGDCLTIKGLVGDGSIDSLRGVPCSDGHNAQAYAIVTLNEASYPGEAAVAREARLACAPQFAPYAAAGRQPYYLYPTASLFNASDGHRAICFVIMADKQPSTGSVVK